MANHGYIHRNGVTGLALLSTGSLLAVVAMVAGALLVLRLQARSDAAREAMAGRPSVRSA